MNQKTVIYIILSAILLYLYYKRGGIALFVAFVVVVAGTLFAGVGASAREGMNGKKDKNIKKNKTNDDDDEEKKDDEKEKEKDNDENQEKEKNNRKGSGNGKDDNKDKNKDKKDKTKNNKDEE